MNRQFLWGAATSAHQVEGNTIHNDWWVWEKRTPGVVRSGDACDHYHCFTEDFALARELGHTAHRLSLEWSRLELKSGEWNKAAVDHYRRVLTSLKDQGLTSFVTLHHFTNPRWLAEQGGWLNTRTPYFFARYAARAAEAFGDLVDFWITINEPTVYVMNSYYRGAWPPHHTSWRETWRALRYLADGHTQAYAAIHKHLPHAHVGVAHHFIAPTPARSTLREWWHNRAFLYLTGATHDFLGITYYRQSPGLTQVLLDMKSYKIPLYIVGNGVATAHDHDRAQFLRTHLRAVEEAQRQGADVRGYLHWSFLDSFEWTDGFVPQFGLVAVDPATRKRRPRQSAYVFRAIIEGSGAEPESLL